MPLETKLYDISFYESYGKGALYKSEIKAPHILIKSPFRLVEQKRGAAITKSIYAGWLPPGDLSGVVSETCLEGLWSEACLVWWCLEAILGKSCGQKPAARRTPDTGNKLATLFLPGETRKVSHCHPCMPTRSLLNRLTNQSKSAFIIFRHSRLGK